jgi:MOSC domain-containing protein YiiM
MPKSYGTAGADDPMDRPWTSGFVKLPVARPVHVGRLGIEGDGQADLKNHGGVDKAVLGYSAEHYPAWRIELDQPDLPHGGFGENLTISGMTEAEICIGDIWEAGDVVLQLSQPRQPCWKLARRWRLQDLSKRVVQTGRSGWYLRVLQEGKIEAGTPMRLTERVHPRWTVAEASRVLYDKHPNASAIAALKSLPELSDGWKSSLPQIRS